MKKKLTHHFWMYEMGAEMISTVNAWDHAIENKDKETAFAMQNRWEAFQISCRYIFGIELHFTRTTENYGICDDSENFFYKVERCENK
ncbi:MAG: hypothetical protein MJ097_00645 [Dorea sp.]|nr:hypothetical protein [Dorea sp.]